jgi:hypothetical protein
LPEARFLGDRGALSTGWCRIFGGGNPDGGDLFDFFGCLGSFVLRIGNGGKLLRILLAEGQVLPL